MAYLRLLRPHQWVKNVFVFAGLIFGRKLSDPHAVALAVVGFLFLSFVSSVVYILNDVHDREEDRHHPRKRSRPLASGEVSVSGALALAGVLLVVALAGSYALSSGFLAVVLCYLALQVAYTLYFKHAVILDVIAIGTGFVLRAIAGAVLVSVEISHWLVLCTFTLCLFLGFGKRRSELHAMSADNSGDAVRHRRTLGIYTPESLNHMTTLTAGIAVVSFMLYATDPVTIRKFGTGGPYLLYTLPMVVYAIFRFAILVERGQVDGPTDVVLRDRPFQAAILIWTAAALLIVYFGNDVAAGLQQLTSQPAR